MEVHQQGLQCPKWKALRDCAMEVRQQVLRCNQVGYGGDDDDLDHDLGEDQLHMCQFVPKIRISNNVGFMDVASQHCKSRLHSIKNKISTDMCKQRCCKGWIGTDSSTSSISTWKHSLFIPKVSNYNFCFVLKIVHLLFRCDILSFGVTLCYRLLTKYTFVLQIQHQQQGLHYIKQW